MLKLKQFIVWVLRRASWKWPPRGEALKDSRVGRNQYRCAKCQKILGRKDVKIDHIVPVVDPDKGFTTFDEYISRMFCEKDGFQVLCDPCHDAKTQDENKGRNEARHVKSLEKKAKKVAK